MKINYQYASPSMCLHKDNKATLGFSPDLSRKENVSFLGHLKHPLIFRDAMLMLREIVISNAMQQVKPRTQFFEWLNKEIDATISKYEIVLSEIRNDLEGQIELQRQKRLEKETELMRLKQLQSEINQKIDQYDVWSDYNKIERDFWKFIKQRDFDLWMVLDPVITVHKDQVSFEAFSIDESIYGCLSIPIEEFELLKEPSLGTTNIDFSAQLATELERFRTYEEVTLSVNPEGFKTKTKEMPEHIEKKIDLPDTWIKGFTQVSSAAILKGINLDITPSDFYDICSFLKRHKAKTSPRYMKWILIPEQPIKILFEPFQKELVLHSIYHGTKKREEKIWGRRRWLTAEKLIPLAKGFQIRFLGFGMPQFIIADLEVMKMTIGLSSWSSNDWVKGTAFSIMAGFIGEGNYQSVYQLLKEKRNMSIKEISDTLGQSAKQSRSGIGMLLKKGEGYYDMNQNTIRFRQLLNTPVPQEFYQSTGQEEAVQGLLKETLDTFTVKKQQNGTCSFFNSYSDTFTRTTSNASSKHNSSYNYNSSSNYNDSSNYNGSSSYTNSSNRTYTKTNTRIVLDEDGQVKEVHCNCREFNKGARNISSPCSHILALYLMSAKIFALPLEPQKEYTINDIMEILL